MSPWLLLSKVKDNSLYKVASLIVLQHINDLIVIPKSTMHSGIYKVFMLDNLSSHVSDLIVHPQGKVFSYLNKTFCCEVCDCCLSPKTTTLQYVNCFLPLHSYWNKQTCYVKEYSLKIFIQSIKTYS
uniref:Disease resistance protein TAO1 n=1 Tax=Rhizophora mucronata TaxID=61149 RepID=A0A2P2MPA2_RHIMU